MSIESSEPDIESSFIVDAAGTNKAVVSTTGQVSVLSTQAGTTATITQVSVGTTSILLLAANANRKSVVICNQGVVTALYIAFAATCSTTLFTYKTATGPNIFPVILGYTGPISAIETGGAVLVDITEIV